MGKDTTLEEKKSIMTYDALEEAVRYKAQEFIQEILEEEITEFLAFCASRSNTKGAYPKDG